MKWITVLFFIGFIGRVVRGNNNDDPAPGRSPGPPLSAVERLSGNLYSLEASHESYRPSENADSSQNLDSNYGNSYSELFSSMSHETEQLHSTEYSDDSEGNIKFSEKIRAINNPNDSTLNTFKNSSSSLPSHATTNGLEKFDRKSTKITNHENSSVTQSSINSDDNDKIYKHKSRCMSGVPTRTRISNYLRLGDRIVQVNSNHMRNSDDESERKFRVDVTHNVFDTSTSLAAGIIYKVEVLQPFPRDVIDFMLETTTTEGNSEAIGVFLFETPVDRNNGETPGDNEGLFEQLVMTSSTMSMKSDSVETNPSDSNSISDQNDCERNVVYHKFNLNDDKVIFNWTTGDAALTAESNFINFRIFYRHRNRREVFETNFTLILLQECTLKLKAHSGWLDSSLLPFHYPNCTFNFPSLTQNRFMQQHPPGMLIKILRLNVPCTSGGYIRFNGTTSLCGKFEELSDTQRTLYFDSFSSTTVTTFNYPKFYFIYKLVDYCYNITLLDRNSSFVIEPTHSLALKCHFKIHLPFGNGIALKLRHQLDANAPTITQEIQLSRQSLPMRDKAMNYILDSEDIDCDGILIELLSRTNEKWSECLLNSIETNVEFTFALPDNVLWIRIVKQIAKSTSVNTDNGEFIINLEYTAVPNESIVSQCAFGWILVDQYCLAAFNELLSWQQAETQCNTLGGHLAAISNDLHQHFVDNMLVNSPHYHEHVSYWIGATDKYFEGDFHWTDGRQFSYTKWFPGWEEHENYNRQPNDDGLSEQDCIEIRRYYQRPMTNGVMSSSSSSLTESFMWNDRDCATKNFFLCERPLIDEPIKTVEFEDCNKTIHLSRDNMKVVVTTPGFPRFYPDNVNCFSFVIAPNGYRILIEFEELMLEQEPQCAYDFIEVFEPKLEQNVNVSSRRARHVLKEKINGFSSGVQQQQRLIEFEQLLHEYEHKKLQARNIFQPSNATYNTFIPPPSTLDDRMPRKICGDWSSKLKLLRYKSNSNSLGIRFTSDYSHHFNGFKAKISLEKAASECVDERLKLFNESCYLVVSFPVVEWVVAQKICHSMGAQLSSVSSLDEHRFIITTIRNNSEYNPQLFYWLGAEYAKNGEFEWTDGSQMSFSSGWHQESDKLIPKTQQTDSICMGLQWKTSNSPRLPSNLFWSSQKCSQLGGYVCKQSKKSNVLIQNMTITETEGQLRSPDYPNQYASNINYWVKIIAPKRSRIVMQFQLLDIEYQEECLYDYVSIQDSEFYHIQSNLNERRSSLSKIGVVNIDYQSDDVRRVLDRRRHARSVVESFNDSFPSFQSYVRWCGKHSGDMTRFDFISRSNEILINFFTDNSIAGEGFSALWRSIDISACPEQTLTSREGNLSSPNFPHFLLHNLNCSYNIQAPIGRKVWLEFLAFDIVSDADVQVDLGDGALLQPFKNKNVISDGVYASKGERIKIHLRTGSHPRGRGFNVIFRTMPKIVEHRVVHLSNSTFGRVYHLNYPQPIPQHVEYSQHLIARLGDFISIELHGLRFANNDSDECNDSNVIEIYDKYADRNGTFWKLCGFSVKEAPIFITSYLNTIHIKQRTVSGNQLGLLNGTIRVHSDINYKIKLITTADDWVEDCNPNPCQNGGKCVTMGKKQVCQCIGHFTGRFCGLTMCELDPCVFGKCELTSNHFKCHCQSGYLGITCDQRQKPCNDNPCENRGQCVEKNGGYECRCFAWFEGPKCERRMKIPYRPLSERMFQEPFWLGLITVFVVLGVIGLVWCAKRHFPEKIEKLLQEEADRNRSAHLRHHHHISLREQLQVAGAANNPIMQGVNSVGNATTPGSEARKSIFNRLGIRKPSILSLSSPQFPPSSSTARTFSLDDLLRPTPRHTHQSSHAGTPSPRKKRNNSTPVQRKNNNVEKKQILQQLVSPNSNKVTLGELIQLSESSNHTLSMSRDSDDVRETTFMDGSTSTIISAGLFSRHLPSDPKLEKKVTFARLLSKMSAEITSGSDIDGNNHSSALSLPTEVQFRANSVPQSPCTNDHIRLISPHSTSSNQGSDSLSSSELALHEFSFRNSRKHRPKVSSADSILAMFRNFASSSAGVNLPPSLIFSPSSTPTASSPQDEIVGDDESSTSSIPTAVSFSSNAPDSPVFYRNSTIEVPVLDAINAHKSTPTQNHLHPPTILLEIPGNINKCLSPIHEMPTPMPSPALTPIMPRPHRIGKSPQVHDETISVTFSDDDDKNQPPLKHHILVDLSAEMNRNDSDDTINTTSSENSHITVRQAKLVSMPAIDICPPSPIETERKSISDRPKDLIIPDLIVQTPSPTRERLPVLIFPGSPPPQRASIGETSGLFPNKQQQKRLMMQYDKYEKPGSLDFHFAPPMIKISMSEVESDTEFLSPATSKANLMPKLSTNGVGMTYLSPFSMCTRGDRAPSEGNLSSSGYSSMASPGPSRCNSNNPLFLSEMDDGHNVGILTMMKRHPSILKRTDECNENGSEQQFRKRSDSETLSDEPLLESNDEGIGTDHLDEKIEEGKIKSAKEMENFFGKELLETGRNLLGNEDVATTSMSQLQLPLIVIQSETGVEKLSPVSSRSESPLSDRNNGMGYFSPQFYNKRDQQLPFTDSDGLYDFPSSDGKGGNSAGSHHVRKSSTGRRRERRNSKSCKDQLQSPSKSSVHLELPSKSAIAVNTTATTSKFSGNINRKSPKRRPARYTPSSSSSTESLTASSNTKDSSMPSIKLRDCLIESIELRQYGSGSVHDESDKYGSGMSSASSKKGEEVANKKTSKSKKIGRMKAIGNQIRFLRRLEKALKERDKIHSSDSCNDNESDIMDSPKASSPLLSSSSNVTKQKATNLKFSRQKRVLNYSFEPEQTETLTDRDLMSD